MYFYSWPLVLFLFSVNPMMPTVSWLEERKVKLQLWLACMCPCVFMFVLSASEIYCAFHPEAHPCNIGSKGEKVHSHCENIYQTQKKSKTPGKARENAEVPFAGFHCQVAGNTEGTEELNKSGGV